MTTPTNLAKGFEPKNVTVLMNGGPKGVWAYENEWKGKSYFHIRSVYLDAHEDWAPAKGLSVPIEDAGKLCAAIVKLTETPGSSVFSS